MSSSYHLRGRVAGLTKARPADDPELADARRELRAAQLEKHVRKIVDQAPPLTEEQRERVATILRSGPSEVATA